MDVIEAMPTQQGRCGKEAPTNALVIEHVPVVDLGRILMLREQRVMLDADLAELYGMPTKVLVRTVKPRELESPSQPRK